MFLLIGVLALISLIGCYVAVRRERAILYWGVRDFLWSMGALITPVYAGLLLLWLRPDGLPLRIAHLFETKPQIAAASVAAAVTLFALAMSFLSTLRANGWPAGAILFVPKTLAGLIVVWFCGGVVSLLLGRQPNIPKRLFSLLMFGFAGILIRALISPRAGRS